MTQERDINVIAMLDKDKIVVGFSVFNDEAQFDRHFKECSKKNLSVCIMKHSDAKRFLLDGTPIV